MIVLMAVVLLWAAGNFVITVLMAPLWVVFFTGTVLVIVLTLFAFMLFPRYFGVSD